MGKTKKESKELAVINPSLFVICAELQAIHQKLESAEGELQEGDFEVLQKWEAALPEKAEKICFFDAKLNNEIEFLQQLEKRVVARRKAKEKAMLRLRKYLRDCMKMTDTKSIKKEDGLFSVNLHDGKTSLVIDDQTKIPLKYLDITEVISVSSDLKKDLEAMTPEDQAKFAGAHIETGEPYVTIR